jgi:uncharacterized protein YegL
MANRPGGEMATRPLHFIWIVDCSGSMAGEKIAALNFAVREALPEMKKVADENPNAQVLIRAVKFSSGAQWHVSQPTDVHSFQWTDLQADGVTDMGRAMALVADALKVSALGERALPPVLVLLSDGHATDDYAGGLKKLMDEPWGKKAARIAIAFGDTDTDMDALQRFIGHPEFKPIVAKNAPSLVKYIKWASTAVLKSASSPASQVAGKATNAATNVPIPTAPAPDTTAADVW